MEAVWSAQRPPGQQQVGQWPGSRRAWKLFGARKGHQDNGRQGNSRYANQLSTAKCIYLSAVQQTAEQSVQSRLGIESHQIKDEDMRLRRHLQACASSGNEGMLLNSCKGMQPLGD